MAALPRDFHHPYKPYDIQIELMNAIYDCIAESKIGIFESPTGTGKSLSLICSSLTWLHDHQNEVAQNQTTDGEESGDPDWVVEQTRVQKTDLLIQRRRELEARLRGIRAKEPRKEQSVHDCEPATKRTKVHHSRKTSASRSDEASYELDEYSSEDEQASTKGLSGSSMDLGLSSASIQMMEKLGLIPKSTSEDQENMPNDELKVYFCSRTHSQLTQFIHEIRRVELPLAAWAAEIDPANDSADSHIVKHVPLGSRKNLCINSKVAKLSSTAAINERCLELQQPNTSKNQRCPFIPKRDNEDLVNHFRDHAIAKIRDIEDLGELGRKTGICPYYASRAAIKPAEIVTLPYPLLLQKSAREALNIELKGQVVIIDEAHNLMDTISNIHSVSVTLTQLQQGRAQLRVYLQKFRNKLKGKNRVYVAQVLRLIESVSAYLENKRISEQSTESIVNVSSLLAGKGVDQINFYKLIRYLQESKLARKAEGFAVHADQQALGSGTFHDAKHWDPTMPVLTHVQSFLQTLANPAAEGRFFYEKDETKEASLKYMLLDPTHHFKQIVDDARAVILAGGTMSPMEDYVHHLFSHVAPQRLMTFSCGHIIPKENLMALLVGKGFGAMDFDFTYGKRNAPAMVDMLGNYLAELSSNVPDGLVVFFPSYAYLEQVISHWKTSPQPGKNTIWDALQSTKPIFCESKSGGVEEVLSQYTQAVATGRGGLLFSVIGGKLSEGINFSDALGRGVVVVGLPFPNIQSAQWKAKLEYIENVTTDRTGRKEEGKAASREFYENACMRAVNQSIGRAIRHRRDYAAIMLLDRRYKTSRIEAKLPCWIRQGIVTGIEDGDSGGPMQSLRSFFTSKVETS